MVFVETTIWDEVFRFAGGKRAAHFRRLLDRDRVALAAPVRAEILCAAQPKDYRMLLRVLSALPVYYPTSETWRRIDGWIEGADEAFGPFDLLIASIAAEHGGEIWTRDRAFSRMAVLGFIELHSG